MQPHPPNLGSLIPDLVQRCRAGRSVDDVAAQVRDLATVSTGHSTWTDETGPRPTHQLAAICEDLLARRIPPALAADALEGWVRAATPDQERYELGTALGRGGTAEVRSAWDRELEREVALKILSRPGRKRSERFVEEARLTAGLEHPGIVPVHDLGETADGRPYFAMKQVRGRSLGQVIAAGEAGSLAVRLGVFSKVCDAVAFAHAQGLLHRDLKPENIMIGAFGEVLVLDWGLAQRSGEGKAGRIAGTPAYMAPEQAARRTDELDRRTDIYGLGAVLYELLTGRPPFAGVTEEVLEQVQQGRFRRPREVEPSVPWELEALINRCMALQPSARFEDVGQLQAEITRFLDGTPLASVPYTPAQRVGKWVRRHQRPVLAAFATATLAGITLAIATAMYSRDIAEQRRVAVAELAVARIAVGDTQLERGDVTGARASFLAAAEGLALAGEDGTRAEVALAQVDDRVPRPLHARVHEDSILHLVISEDGRQVLSCGQQRAVLSSLPGLEDLAAVELPEDTTSCRVAFAAERPLVLTTAGGRARLMDVQTGVVTDDQPWAGASRAETGELRPEVGRFTLTGGGTEIYRLGGDGPFLTVPGQIARLSPNGTHAVVYPVYPDRGSIEVLDLTTGTRTPVIHDTSASKLFWLDDDTLMLSTDGVSIVRLSISGHLKVWQREVPPFRGLGLDRAIVWTTGWDRVLRAYDTSTGVEAFALPLVNDDIEYHAAIDAHVASQRVVAGSTTGEIWLHPGIGRAPAPVLLPGESNYGVDASPDGRLAVVASQEAGVSLVELASRRVLRTWPMPEAGSRTARFSGDGTRVAVAVRDGTVRILDLVGSAPERVLTPGDERVLSVAWLDADHLLSCGTDGDIVRWDLTTSQIEGRIHAYDTHMWDLALSGDHRRLLTGGYAPPHTQLRLWDPWTLEPLATGPSGGVFKFRLALDETGDLALAADHDGTVMVWEPATGRTRHLASDIGPTLGLARVPGSSWVVATGYDGDLTLLDVDAPEGRGEIRRWDLGTEPGLATAITPDGKWAIQVGGTKRMSILPLRRPPDTSHHIGDVAELAERLEQGRVWHELLALLDGQEQLAPHAYARAALALGQDADALRILRSAPAKPGEQAWASIVRRALEATEQGTE